MGSARSQGAFARREAVTTARPNPLRLDPEGSTRPPRTAGRQPADSPTAPIPTRRPTAAHAARSVISGGHVPDASWARRRPRYAATTPIANALQTGSEARDSLTEL